MRINHVTLLVSDKKQSEEFYVSKLGFKKHAIGSRLWIRVGEQFIHLSSNSGIPVTGTFYHFAIEVNDVVDYVQNLFHMGIEVFETDDNGKAINVNLDLDRPNRCYFVRDPDGNMIEFIEDGSEFFNPVL